MHSNRPNSLAGMLWRLASLNVKPLMVALVIAVVLVLALCQSPATDDDLRIVTFNIENYPKSAGQEAGAVDLIASLDADVVAVQEILKADVFRENVELYLGEHWEVAMVDQEVYQQVGLVWDTTVLELVDTVTHDETVVHRGMRATLEGRFRTGGGESLRLFVLHLKAYSEGVGTRRKQLAALQPIVEEAVASGDEVVVLGDFNATGKTDRLAINAFAAETGLEWTSRELSCTSFWDRRDVCATSALDHMLSTEVATDIDVAGACKTTGCDMRDACPTYTKGISDHCPVVAKY